MKYAILALATVTFLTSTADAITFNTFSATLPGTSVQDRPELAGDIIDSQSIPFNTGINNTTAILQNWVVRESGTGTVDFYFQFSNPSATDTVVINQTAITGFDIGPTLDVDMRNDLGGVFISSFASRLFGGPSAPDQLGLGSNLRGSAVWNLTPGTSLAPILVHTSATGYDNTGQVTVVPNLVTTSAFIPAASGASIPEPLGLTLLSLALAMLAVRVRARRDGFTT